MKKNTKKINVGELSLILFIVGMILLIFIGKITTYDYWWHTKVGEYIINTKNIPKTGIFSWYALENNLNWISHEWLSEVVIYLCSKIGLIGAYLFIIINLLILFVFIFKKNIKNILNNYLYALIWIIIGCLLFASFSNARPHMISFNLLAFSIYIILKFREDESYKGIYLIPIISLLWSNFHGGSSNLPYVLCFIVLITGLFNFKYKKITFKKLSKKQVKTFILIIILSIIAIAINPHGLKMITYPYVNMSDTTMLNAIYEWKAPDIKILSELFIFIEIFAIIFVLFLTDEVDFTDFALLGAFIYLTLKSIRFSALLYIVATFIIFKYVKPTNTPKIKECLTKIMFRTGIIAIIIYIISLGGIIKNPFDYNISDKVITAIKNENPKRLYNDYNLGCYLIYNGIPVFIDGRADMYSKYTLKDAINLDNLADDPEKIIKKYNFDLFVIESDSSLSYYFKNSDEYKLIIEDKKDNVTVYKPIKK